MNSVTKVILNHNLNKSNFFIKIFAYILETLEDFDIQESNKNLSNYGLNETKGNKVSPFHKSFNKILILLKVFIISLGFQNENGNNIFKSFARWEYNDIKFSRNFIVFFDK